MSCPPTTYYQGPPYLMGGPGGTAYAPPPMNYTPMPYMTENFRGDASGVEAYRGTPTTGGEGFRGLIRGVAGGVAVMRTTGVGGSETSVASGNSNSSSKSVESVCHVKKEDGEGEGNLKRKPLGRTSS